MTTATIHCLDEARRLAREAVAPDVRSLAGVVVETDDAASAERAEIRRAVAGLDVLVRDNAARLTVITDSVDEDRQKVTVAINGLRLAVETGFREAREERDQNRQGILEAIAIAHRAEGKAREAHASDVDLLATVEREREAREAEHARLSALIQAHVTPALAKVAHEEASSTRKTVAGTAGVLTAIYTVVEILRAIGVLK